MIHEFITDFLIGITILIPSFIILAFAQTKFTLWFGLILFSIASSVVINVINSFASKYGLQSEKGTILGIFRSLQALARAIGPLSASFAYWSIGEKTTYLIGSLLLICPLILLFNVQYSLKRIRSTSRDTINKIKSS
ncbi:unnamed protein product [Adineta steineri]|uniref:Major facilitator superfamily (MFS) profile domain-containing protein n=2 Tax=Adineta steineri TaxID=433720 RepID=A0A814D2G6_9BILA|nr:unnamed protein product [Adineta steineri]CAF0948411.1 unnamed protein product [Adineta steineri]CAF3531675.1 unnamed protein product [Adineta steineri]